MANPVLQIRLSDERRKRYTVAADSAGVHLLEWMRGVCDVAASSAPVSVPTGKVVKNPKAVKAPVKVAKVAPVAVAPVADGGGILPDLLSDTPRPKKRYTGETTVMYGRVMYEIEVDGEMRWTGEAE